MTAWLFIAPVQNSSIPELNYYLKTGSYSQTEFRLTEYHLRSEFKDGKLC